MWKAEEVIVAAAAAMAAAGAAAAVVTLHALPVSILVSFSKVMKKIIKAVSSSDWNALTCVIYYQCP